MQKANDLYLDVSTKSLYETTDGISWNELIKFNGSFIRGTSPPTNSLGVEGDSYFDQSTGYLYGPKGSTSWPVLPINIINGGKLLSGVGIDILDTDFGIQGDYYIDLNSLVIYGPKKLVFGVF